MMHKVPKTQRKKSDTYLTGFVLPSDEQLTSM